MMGEDFFIAMDIGATNVRIARTRSLENPSFENVRNFRLSHDFKADFDKITNTAKEIAKQKISAVGVALPGRLNENKSSLAAVVNLPEWVGKNIKEGMEAALKCEAFFENDAVASGLGYAVYNKPVPDDFLFIIWGTGVGGAIVHTHPALKSEKLDRKEYLSKIEAVCGGKTLLQKYGEPFSKLGEQGQNKLIDYFLSNISQQAKKMSVGSIVLGGGIAIDHGEKILSAASKLPAVNRVTFQITPQGNMFGLYGAAALIKLSPHG